MSKHCLGHFLGSRPGHHPKIKLLIGQYKKLKSPTEHLSGTVNKEVATARMAKIVSAAG